MNISILEDKLTCIDGLDPGFYESIVACFTQLMDLQNQKIKILEDQLRKVQRLYFGRKSERFDTPGQQCIEGVTSSDQLLTAQTLDDVLAATELDELQPQSLSNKLKNLDGEAKRCFDNLTKKQKMTSGGRLDFPAHLKEVETVIELPESERMDKNGETLPCVGYKTTKCLGYRSAEYVVQIEKRAIYGRPFNDEQHRVVTPTRMIYAKSSLSNELIASLIHAKFANHLPMYRIEQHFEAAGINNFTRRKLSRALIHVAHLPKVQLVYDAIKSEILQHPSVQLDDTTCPMLKPGTKKTATTRIWALTNGKNAWYHHALNRSGSVCFELLKDYSGHIQCDDYGGHNCLFVDEQRQRVACMAHIRRKFYDIIQEPFANEMVRLIQKLYNIETYLKKADTSPLDRVRYRQRHAEPLLNYLFKQLDTASQNALYVPQSSLGKAISYARKQRSAMFKYIEYGHLDIDNNNCERAMRRIALGRKNYLFVGNEDGGKTVSVWCTIVETCRRHQINAEQYLNWLFARVTDPSLRLISSSDLTPHAYSKSRPYFGQ